MTNLLILKHRHRRAFHSLYLQCWFITPSLDVPKVNTGARLGRALSRIITIVWFFVVNCNNSVGSLCYVLRNSISISTVYEICCTEFHQYIHRVQSLCYSSLRRSFSVRFRSKERPRKGIFSFGRAKKSETTQKRLLRRLVLLLSWAKGPSFFSLIY